MPARAERRLARDRGLAVPGADVLAHVAPEHPRADARPELARYRPPVFDRQVRDASAGVQHVRLDESSRGARVQAPGAAAAAVGQRGVGLEARRGQHGPDEEEGAEARVEQHRVLPDPAQAGARGEVPLQQGPRVHVGSRRRPWRQPTDRLGEGGQPVLHDGVVILAPGVARYPGRALRGRSLEVAKRAGHHRACPGQDPSGIEPLVPAPIEIRHRAGAARVEPALERRGMIGGTRRADGDQVEAKTPPRLLDLRRQRRGRHGALRGRHAGRARPPGSR